MKPVRLDQFLVGSGAIMKTETLNFFQVGSLHYICPCQDDGHLKESRIYAFWDDPPYEVMFCEGSLKRYTTDSVSMFVTSMLGNPASHHPSRRHMTAPLVYNPWL